MFHRDYEYFHDSITNEWIFNSINITTGHELRVEMEQLVKFLDQEFGTNFVKEYIDGELVELEDMGDIGEDGIIEGNQAPDMSTSFLTTLTDRIVNVLEWLGLKMEDGVATVKGIVTEVFTAKTARVQRMEMVDSATGEIYCTWIANGEMKRELGDCDSVIGEYINVEPELPANENQESDDDEPIVEEDLLILDVVTPSDSPTVPQIPQEPLIETTTPSDNDSTPTPDQN